MQNQQKISTKISTKSAQVNTTFKASEDWTQTARGVDIVFGNAPTGGLGVPSNMIISNSGATQVKKLNIGQKEAKKETESFIKKILNTKSLKNSAQVLKTIDDVAERFDETTKDFLQNDVLKNSEAEELATLMSRDKGEILKALPKEGERAKTATVRMIASKQILQELAFQLKQTSEQ